MELKVTKYYKYYKIHDSYHVEYTQEQIDQVTKKLRDALYQAEYDLIEDAMTNTITATVLERKSEKI